MGTRNLTCVVLNGEYKIAQYGQWDGYPSGQGNTALRFIRQLVRNPKKMTRFVEYLQKCKFYSTEELEALDQSTPNEMFERLYPHLCRNMGAEILERVYNSPDGLSLFSQIDFAGDSLFCEWTYVLDLDKKTFEVYAGFNQKALLPDERFFNSPKDRDYYPVKLLVSFSLDKLPTSNKFVSICDDLYSQRRESDKLPKPSPDAMEDGLGI